MSRATVHLAEEIELRRGLVRDYLDRHRPAALAHRGLQEGVWEYVRRGGKFLRGTVCLLSCGLFGGDEQSALPAAAAIEVFHAWTLVHDDIVDRDTTRRGGPTLHRHYVSQARAGHDPAWYGLSMALLAGDIQQAWSAELLCSLAERFDPALAVRLVREMSGLAVPRLVEGEVQDIELSGMPFAEIHEADILEMMDKKTAVLYRFSGLAGAWLGRRSAAPDPAVDALCSFLTDLGLAFQFRDDLLGVSSSEAKTGKDSDSDIREGKRTLIAALAHARTDGDERRLLERVLGNASATAAEIQSVRELFTSTRAIADVEARAHALVDRAMATLRHLPDRPQRDVLESLALFLVQRES